MLIPFGTQANDSGNNAAGVDWRQTDGKSPLTRSLTGTALADGVNGEAGWVDMVATLLGAFDAYVCVLLLDDAAASRDIARIVEANYVRIDSLTGDSLLVLTTVPPPQAWFSVKDGFFRRLPAGAREYHARELNWLSTPEGQTRARYDAQRLAARHLGAALTLPALCYVQPCPSIGDPDGVELKAHAFDISGLRSETALMDALQFLAELASKKQELGASALDLAESAHSIVDVRSLRWRNALSKTGRTIDFVKLWFHRASLG